MEKWRNKIPGILLMLALALFAVVACVSGRNEGQNPAAADAGVGTATDTAMNADTETAMGQGENPSADTDILTAAQFGSLIIHEEEIAFPGLKEEFELVFLADTHLSLCDERDPELLEKAASRYEGFRDADGEGADKSFQVIMDYVAAQQPDLLVLGGDIVDSAMWASIEFVEESLSETGVPWIYEMGNHDFEYGAECFSDMAYAEYLPRLSEAGGTQDGYQTVEYDGFVVFSVDDKNNQVCGEAVEALKSLYEKGKPVILVTHVPVQPPADDVLLEETKRVWQPAGDGSSRVLMGPDACEPNETTEMFLNLVLDGESPVVMILAGHIHFYHRDMLTEDIVQVVTGAGFKKELVKVTLKPGF